MFIRGKSSCFLVNGNRRWGVQILIQSAFMKRECYELVWSYAKRAVAMQYGEVLDKY